MAELLLINPRHKRRSRRRKMSALQRRFFGGGRRRKTRRSRTSLFGGGRRRVRRLRRNPAVVPVTTGRRRRRFSRARRYVSRSRRRRGGGSMGLGGVMEMLVPAGIGAAGAIALDMAYASLPLPASLTTGTLAPVTRIAGAIAIGVAVGAVMGRRNGALAGAGALTVTMYDIIKPLVASSFPSVPGLGYWNPARTMGTYVGAYVGR